MVGSIDTLLMVSVTTIIQTLCCAVNALSNFLKKFMASGFKRPFKQMNKMNRKIHVWQGRFKKTLNILQVFFLRGFYEIQRGRWRQTKVVSWTGGSGKIFFNIHQNPVFLSPANELDIVNPVPTSRQENCSWNLGVKVRNWCGEIEMTGLYSGVLYARSGLLLAAAAGVCNNWWPQMTS